MSTYLSDLGIPTKLYRHKSDRIAPIESYLSHLFFSLDNSDSWINLLAFQAYMGSFHASFDEYRTRNSTPFSFRAPSRAAPSVQSRAPSRADSSFSVLDSRPTSRASYNPSSRAPSSRSSSPFPFDIVISDDQDFSVTVPPPLMAPKLERVSTPPLVATVAPSVKKRKGKQKAAPPEIKPNLRVPPLCSSVRFLPLRRKRLPPSLSPPRCVPATSSTPTQPRLSLQIPARAVAPRGLALPVPVQGADTPLCGSHARPPGLGKLGNLRADATGRGGATPHRPLLWLVVVRSTVWARRSARGNAQALIELLPSSFELRDLNLDEDLR
ncbi:hypothetical protein B0H14DRAFT_3451534 [Mycena olivaceomarginata]|nr:hypothetical protein B0H14DRAFT_3451534 [Mycena olivaceomarginata]